MPIDLLASVLVVLLAAVSVVMFVRGVLGFIARREQPPHWHL